MAFKLPTPPLGLDVNTFVWKDWFNKLQQAFTNIFITVDQGGTGLATLGTSNQVLGVDSSASGLEYKSIVAGSNVSVSHGAGSITISASSTSAPSNSLSSDLTVSQDTSYVVIGYFNLNGYTANIDGNMEIL